MRTVFNVHINHFPLSQFMALASDVAIILHCQLSKANLVTTWSSLVIHAHLTVILHLLISDSKVMHHFLISLTYTNDYVIYRSSIVYFCLGYLKLNVVKKQFRVTGLLQNPTIYPLSETK